jgi:hypothetical protein
MLNLAEAPKSAASPILRIKQNVKYTRGYLMWDRRPLTSPIFVQKWTGLVEDDSQRPNNAMCSTARKVTDPERNRTSLQESQCLALSPRLPVDT